MVPSGADVPGESTEVRDIAMEGTPKDNADDAIEAASDESHEMLQYGKSTVTLVQSKKDEADEPPPLSEAQSGGFFGQASKFMGTVFGVNKKVKTEPVKSLQLAAAAAKKEQEEKEKKASRLKEMEHRRALATQRKAEEEKAHAVEEDKKMKEEAERRKREREEQTEKRPLKFAPKKDDDNTKKRKIAVDEKKPEAKKIPPKDATRATKPTVKPPVQNKPSTSFRPTTAAASSSQSVAGTAGSNGTAKTTAAPPPSSKPAKALPPSGLAANATKGKAKMKAPEEDLRQPSEVVQTQMVARIEAQLKAQQPKIASESIELPDINSEYSDSDDEDRKRTFDPPEWAQSPDLRAQLQQQSTINPDEIFGSVQPLVMEKIFAKRHSKFRARTSSANWTGTDELTKHEEKEYAKRMGFRS
ncbi:hypothetical protein PUNSTDRAFT_95050 [Punctularia strigosozonata HHB-11173 SS5]|uniref:uncharacterized protein n=1 Tax=Punctularia strigosozonata (strain HHB-11173) TaxID=741275 RepID=UPI0004417B89|nr:uncharacterized protein PUNSTDRAFT_95050 [Punctularia strigosozonata HHB-11173 SS5]EIN13759.1 hypothetical protein PUNSTDRAFT_95050 [Punctularia strigosozonata HHB-11173 SS5]